MEDKETSMATWAEKIERFDDIVKHTDEMFAAREKVVESEVRLACIGYKNILEQDRNSIAAIKEFINSPSMNEMISEYKIYLKFLEDRFAKNCLTFVSNLKWVISKTGTDTNLEFKVQILKTLGDYHRYLIEVDSESIDAKYKDSASAYYKNAYNIVQDDNFSSSILKLSVELNYAIFLYDTMNSKQQGFQILKSGLDTGLIALENHKDDEDLKDFTFLLNLVDRTLFEWRDGSKQEI